MYVCWNCGLIYGDDEDEEGSRLCPACKAAGVKDQGQGLGI